MRKFSIWLLFILIYISYARYFNDSEISTKLWEDWREGDDWRDPELKDTLMVLRGSYVGKGMGNYIIGKALQERYGITLSKNHDIAFSNGMEKEYIEVIVKIPEKNKQIWFETLRISGEVSSTRELNPDKERLVEKYPGPAEWGSITFARHIQEQVVIVTFPEKNKQIWPETLRINGEVLGTSESELKPDKEQRVEKYPGPAQRDSAFSESELKPDKERRVEKYPGPAQRDSAFYVSFLRMLESDTANGRPGMLRLKTKGRIRVGIDSVAAVSIAIKTAEERYDAKMTFLTAKRMGIHRKHWLVYCFPTIQSNIGKQRECYASLSGMCKIGMTPMGYGIIHCPNVLCIFIAIKDNDLILIVDEKYTYEL